MLFDAEITRLADWADVFQEKRAFLALARRIYAEQGLPFEGLQSCTPGSNAVFRSGKTIVKIFAPEESEIGGEAEYAAERFGLARANRLGIPAPALLGDGVIRDRYVFRYLVMEAVPGEPLSALSGELSGAERARIGRTLRRIIERMDTPCERFSAHTLRGLRAERRWAAFPESFRRERLLALNEYPASASVFVHGDLNPDNILLDAEGTIRLIDFADARVAPIELELAAIVCEGFRFDVDYLRGFFGGDDRRAMAERLTVGLLMHDYGANIIRDRFGSPEGIDAIATLKRAIQEQIEP